MTWGRAQRGAPAFVFRRVLSWLRGFLGPRYVEFGPPRASRRAHVKRVCPAHPPAEHPLAGGQGRVRFDPSRPFEASADGLLVQRASVDLLLSDGRMSRLGILACYDPVTHEPRRISYIPIHEVVPSPQTVGPPGPPDHPPTSEVLP